MISLFVLIPFVSLIVLNVLFNMVKRLSFWLVIMISLAQIYFSGMLLFNSGGVIKYDVYAANLFSLLLKLSADNLSLLLLLTIGIVLFVSIMVGRYTIPDERKRFNFFSLLLIALMGMNTIVMTTDIFSLYVFMEITAVALFVMIAMEKDIFALEGAFKYMVLSAIATILILTAIALIIMVSGGTSFAAISSAIKSSSGSLMIKFAVILFLCGLFVKSGLVPFHGWLPDAYSAAPNAVSVFLAGIVTKVTGVYVLMRVVISVFGFTEPVKSVLMFIGALSIIIGAFAALGQSNFKRMLAYSSISQVGYIILALGCGTNLALAGAAFHLFNHAIFKSLLFVNAASVENRLHTVDMDKMGGLSCRMPVTGATSVIGLLSTAGIPPFSGFWSKFIIIVALWNAARYGYAVIALLMSIVTLAYFLSMQRRVFFGKLRPGLENVSEAEFGLVLPQVILAAIVVGVGIFFPMVLNKFILPAANILR